MTTSKKFAFALGGVLLAAAATAAFLVFPNGPQDASAVTDPRLEAPIVRMAAAAAVAGSGRRFTGVVAARVQSDVGFRVSGKIVERFVDVGQRVKASQPLMRIDETDLRLALKAERDSVAVARASVVQAKADERRYSSLISNGWTSRQRYEQAKAMLDTAMARLAAAEAEARVVENQASYSVLMSDVDGTVVETLVEPGQVVASGQIVARIAAAGPREAVVALPETVRPAIGSEAEASVYGSDKRRERAQLRELSDSADPRTRTYEARYVLEGDAAAAPLGATVTIHLMTADSEPEVEVPLGAVLDNGHATGVWVLDGATSTVTFRPVELVRLTSETAVVAGLRPGEPIVALGAHLLREGARVRSHAQSETN